MYDEKYHERGNVKKIESIGEAKAILLVKEYACGSCYVCPVRMYEESKGSGCGDVEEAAKAYLRERGEPFAEEYEDDTDVAAKELYNAFVGGCKEPTPQMEEPEQPHAICTGTCAACLNSRMHSSGIRWCGAFGNFVHEDGYCYRFVTSANMEDVQMVQVYVQKHAEKEEVPAYPKIELKDETKPELESFKEAVKKALKLPF